MIKKYSNSCSAPQSSARSKCSSSSSSAYQSVLCFKNLQNMLLPAFVRLQDPVPFIPSPVKLPRKLQEESEILDYIYSSRTPAEPLVRIGKIQLNQNDLKSILCGNLSQKAIEGLLTVFKYANMKVVKENVESKKVLIAKTSFTEKVFNNEKTDGFLKDVDFSIIVFPIFIGYWTVLCFNSKEMVVNYFDPLKNQNFLKDILKNFYRFLKRQEQKDLIMAKPIKDLVYQKIIINESWEQSDSVVFMLQTVLNISTNSYDIVLKSELDAYKRNFLKLLFKFGNICT